MVDPIEYALSCPDLSHVKQVLKAYRDNDQEKLAELTQRDFNYFPPVPKVLAVARVSRSY